MADTGLDPSEITPEQFAQLVAGASDEDIMVGIHTLGTAKVLDRIFNGFEERFLPDKAAGVDADVQFVITDEGEQLPYAVKIHDKTCKVDGGTVDSPKVTLTTDVLSFSKLVTGQAQGPQLFMKGKLKIAGDLMFATRVMTFFDRPSAG